jgi:cytochrome b involved in lipid metabolism
METYLIGEYVKPREFSNIIEIADHNKPDDLWLLINNKVYDVSRFKHPGITKVRNDFL